MFDASLYPIPPHRCLSHGPCDLCHHRLFSVIFVSDILPPLQLSASLTLLLIHLVTSVTAAATDFQTIVTIAPQNCQMIENNLFRWWPVDKKYAGGRRLCYISTSIPVILEFISIETWSQTVYLKDLWVKRPDENRISEMTLEFYKEHHFSTHSRS